MAPRELTNFPANFLLLIRPDSFISLVFWLPCFSVLWGILFGPSSHWALHAVSQTLSGGPRRRQPGAGHDVVRVPVVPLLLLLPGRGVGGPEGPSPPPLPAVPIPGSSSLLRGILAPHFLHPDIYFGICLFIYLLFDFYTFFYQFVFLYILYHIF